MYSNQTLSGTEITTDPINLCIFNNEGGMVHTSFLLHVNTLIHMQDERKEK